MRILFILPEYPPYSSGGVGTFYGALLPALVKCGHEVGVVMGSAFVSEGKTYELDGVKIHSIQSYDIDRNMHHFSRYAPLPEVQRHLAAAYALWELSEGGQRFDIVEVVDWGMLFAPWIAKEGPPVVVRLHSSCGQIASNESTVGFETSYETYRHLEVGLLPYASALETVSESNAVFWRMQTNSVVTVAPPPLFSSPALNLDRHKVGFVAARIQDWKGPHVLAEALVQLGPSGPIVEWAGSAAMHPTKRKPYDEVLALEYPSVWPNRLRPVGRLKPIEVRRHQAKAAFVVVPSLWDVYNLSIAEAMQQECVVLCSGGAGGADLIESGYNGFVFPSGDSHSLSKLLIKVTNMSDYELGEIGKAARETVMSVTNPDKAAAAMIERYTDLIKNHTRSHPPSWLSEAVLPAPPSSIDSFLYTLPLRSIMSHSFSRIFSKFF